MSASTDAGLVAQYEEQKWNTYVDDRGEYNSSTASAADEGIAAE